MKRSILSIFLVISMFIISSLTSRAWSPRIRLTWDNSSSWNPVVAIDQNNNIHVVWENGPHEEREIYYKKSTNLGTDWSARTRLTWNSGDSVYPNIATDSNNHIHVVWYDSTYGNNEILYKKSTDGGVSWSALVRLTWNSGDSARPAIAIGPNDNIHVVWDDTTYGNKEILYKRSTDSGASWSAVDRLTWTPTDAYHGDVAVDSDNNVRVVWNDWGNGGSSEIMFKRSQDDGVTWGPRTRLTYTSGASYMPHLAINVAKVIFMVWYDKTPGNFDIYFKKSTDGGLTWSSSYRLTYNSGASNHPSIHVDSPSALHATWTDDSSGVYEIYYKSSTDAGDTWSALTRLTWNYPSASSYGPSLTADNENRVRLVWADNSSGSYYEIYFKRQK